jgi:GNAT superfamily N-acetyltransferase
MRLLRTVNDKLGHRLDIYHQNTLFMCPALSKFLVVYAEIIDKGFANPAITFSNDCHIVWATTDNNVVGGIVYEINKNKTAWIVLSFVEPECRGRGIYSHLHSSMEQLLRGQNVIALNSLVHVNNQPRLRSAEKEGFKPQFYRMHKEIR